MRDLYTETQELIDEYYSDVPLGKVMRKTRDIAYRTGDYHISLMIDMELISLNGQSKSEVNRIQKMYFDEWANRGLVLSDLEKRMELEIVQHLRRRTIDDAIVDQLSTLGYEYFKKGNVTGSSIDEIEYLINVMTEIIEKKVESKSSEYSKTFLKLRFFETVITRTRDYYRGYIVSALEGLRLGVIESLLPSFEICKLLANVAYESSLPRNLDKLLSAICNAFEYLLYKDGKYIDIDIYSTNSLYNKDCGFINNSNLISYRKKIQCFRHHKSEESLVERSEFSDFDKLQFIRVGVVYLEHILQNQKTESNVSPNPLLLKI